MALLWVLALPHLAGQADKQHRGLVALNSGPSSASSGKSLQFLFQNQIALWKQKTVV